MAEEKRIPAFIFRIAYDIVDEEAASRATLDRVLELAGLDRYIDEPPPFDSSPAITRTEFEKIVGVVWQVFDEVQARAILRRTGYRAFEHLTRSGVLSFSQFLRAFAPESSKSERVAIAMRRLTEELSRAMGSRHEFHRDGQDFILDIYDCPYCAELTRGATLTPEARVCYIPVAFYEAAVNWASGENSTVREISCGAATLQNFCRFKIFWNIGLKKPAE